MPVPPVPYVLQDSDDLGPGYLPYKMDWAPEVIPLVASTHAVSLAGLPIQAKLVATTAGEAARTRSSDGRTPGSPQAPTMNVAPAPTWRR